MIKRLIGGVLFALALVLLLSALGIFGGGEARGNVLDSPEASGRLLGPIIGAVVLAAGGAFLWQKPKPQ